MTVGGLDPVIHPTNRLRICAMLNAAEYVEMGVVRDSIELSPSALSKQIAALVEAGYVRQSRSEEDSRRIWLMLTRDGKRAYRGHVKALKAIVETAELASEERLRAE